MPDGTGRIVTTEELARFAECRLAWWYDRTHPLARANADELTRRIDLLGTVYGPGARDLPEHQLLRHLRERAGGMPAATPKAAPPADVGPTERPHRLLIAIILIGAIVVGGVLASIVFSLTQR
jgi:hypothetical protein